MKMKLLLITLFIATTTTFAGNNTHEEVATGDNAISCTRKVTTRGDTVFVNLTIERKNLYSSLGRICESIPANTELKVIQKENATVKIKEGRVSFVFFPFPEKKTTEISYALIVKDNKQKELEIYGLLQYLYNDYRQNFDIPPTVVNLK